MEFIADLHIHSHFSRATSILLEPGHLDYWGRIKGVAVVGTGDFTHPGWLAELRQKTEPEGNGLFRLKKEYCHDPLIGGNDTKFLLSAEISNIYKREGKVRKVHNIVLVPDFEDAEKINRRLADLGGNLKSDGRPILGLDSRDLLDIVLNCNEENIFIPAHIWTPWFSMLGSKSGFDSPEECFGDLWPYIFSTETGLSTDAPMNWLCSFLDRCTLISNSDAHSPERLGRNANIFNTELSFSGIREALISGSPEKFLGTIDLFPQEGKYHYDGHRKCNVCWDPVETIRNHSICPKCGKPVTVGVMNRVIRLSDREDFRDRKNRLPFRSVIPLKELLAEISDTGVASKKIQEEYERIILKLGNELNILINVAPEEIETRISGILAEAIRRMRNREVVVKEGYDGEYGQIKVFNPGEIKMLTSGSSLFKVEKNPVPPTQRGLLNFDLKGIQDLIRLEQDLPLVAENKPIYEKPALGELNSEQTKAVEYYGGPSIILAGPGTGKTKTLTSKIAWLIRQGKAGAAQILAITFTNKAALEMKTRIAALLSENTEMPWISTFHAFGKKIVEENAGLLKRSHNFIILDEEDKLAIVKEIPGVRPARSKQAALNISLIKQAATRDFKDEDLKILSEYENKLEEYDALDFDDLIAKPLELFRTHPEVLRRYRDRYPVIFIDEFQDTNKLQFELIRLLADGGNPDLCVVGDPNQAIYGFRGGGSGMIDRFTEEFPDARIFRLRTSYRCSQNILSASSDVLAVDPGFLSGLNQGVRVTLSEQATDKSEAEFIARQIVNLSGGLSFFSIDSDVSEGQQEDAISSLSDFAVLCRTRHQFEVIEKAFRDHNIPYQVVGEKPFYTDPPFSELLNIYFIALFQKKNSYAEWLIRERDVIFKENLKNLRSSVSTLPIKQGLEKIKKEFFDPGSIDEQDFRRLTGMAGSSTPLEFMASLKLRSAADVYDEKQEAITLMTLHASKGLEFECVFIAGCEQGLIPYNLYNTNADQDEERRLLYVGMTRSKKFLYLSHAGSRNFRNRHLKLPGSMFLEKIKKELIEKSKPEYRKKQAPGEQLDLF